LAVQLKTEACWKSDEYRREEEGNSSASFFQAFFLWGEYEQEITRTTPL
jgi:hypothetical protein